MGKLTFEDWLKGNSFYMGALDQRYEPSDRQKIEEHCKSLFDSEVRVAIDNKLISLLKTLSRRNIDSKYFYENELHVYQQIYEFDLPKSSELLDGIYYRIKNLDNSLWKDIDFGLIEFKRASVHKYRIGGMNVYIKKLDIKEFKKRELRSQVLAVAEYQYAKIIKKLVAMQTQPPLSNKQICKSEESFRTEVNNVLTLLIDGFNERTKGKVNESEIRKHEIDIVKKLLGYIDYPLSENTIPSDVRCHVIEGELVPFFFPESVMFGDNVIIEKSLAMKLRYIVNTVSRQGYPLNYDLNDPELEKAQVMAIAYDKYFRYLTGETKDQSKVNEFRDLLLVENKDEIANLLREVFSNNKSPKEYAIMFVLLIKNCCMDIPNRKRKMHFESWYRFIDHEIPKRRNFQAINKYMAEKAKGFWFYDQEDGDYRTLEGIFDKNVLPRIRKVVQSC
jgi:hypothetical protein